MVSKRKVLKAAGAAAVNGMVPAATVIVTVKAVEAEGLPPVARIPLPPDPIKECERLAGELARAMNNVRNGNYRITIRHSLGYVQIEDHAFRVQEEGPLVGTEAYEEWEQKRALKRLLARA
ncbi:hypothetical protein [Taklimakanibacter albus]|uniref:Uncharacterized protein n=1 Tax=Taklimakanibacter albus TaxID=2800327 RepID=A0ACC5R1X7_9HYPH|nr:hypothetical protein [Aestuariivirga sp. YIM B02566]MBK1866408.1 hypothetical protein [Aestuariivirga sp. YIM B02566]